MEAPPPAKRPSKGRAHAAAATSGGPMDVEPSARPAAAAAASEPCASLKRLQKTLREIERLTVLEEGGQTLSQQEREKVLRMPSVAEQIRLLTRTTPAQTPVQTPVQTPQSTPSSSLSAAHTQRAVNAASAAADFTAAHERLDSLQTSPKGRPPTRATATEVAQQLEQQRAERASERAAAHVAAQAAEETLWRLLRAPFDSWDDEVLWQLALCEYALVHLDDVASTAKQLQLAFRAECEEARHPEDVPRLRGSLQIDALQLALHRSTLLSDELQRQLARICIAAQTHDQPLVTLVTHGPSQSSLAWSGYKRLYCSILTGLGRFRKLKVLPGETLLQLLHRTHHDALK
jgi:hypothetical protein